MSEPPSSLKPLYPGVYRFNTVDDDLRAHGLACDYFDSDESDDNTDDDSEGYYDDDDDDDSDDDDDDDDDVDSGSLSCLQGSTVVADGPKGRRHKVEKSAISQPEQIQSPSAIKDANLHFNKEVNDVMNEIIRSERRFVGQLLLINTLKAIMKSANFLSEDDIEEIFPDLQPVLNLHGVNLLPALEKEAERAERTSTPAAIGGVFMQHAKSLLRHKKFISNQPHAVQRIRKLEKENMPLRKRMKKFKSSIIESDKITIGILMAHPQKNMHDFELLFGRYIKKLEELAEGQDDLQNAQRYLVELENILKEINDSIKKQQNRGELIKLRSKLLPLGLDIMIIQPDQHGTRELIDYHSFLLFDPHKGTTHKYKVYLLNDMVLAYRKSRPDRLWCIGHRSLKVKVEEKKDGMSEDDVSSSGSHHMVAADDQDCDEPDKCKTSPPEKQTSIKESSSPCMLILYGREAVLELEVESKYCANIWATEIEKFPKDAHIIVDPEDPDFPLGRRAPRLNRMAQARSCQRCHVVFKGKIKRHCEACGRVVCVECSKHKTILYFSPEEEKLPVCSSCWQKIQTDSQ